MAKRSHKVASVCQQLFMNRNMTLIILGSITLPIIICSVVLAFHQVAKETEEGPGKAIRETGDAFLDLAERAGKDFDAVFHAVPQTIVNHEVIYQQTTPVAELATAKREMRCTYNFKQVWLRSTKTMEISGIFRAKAGFDLNKFFQIDFEETNHTVSIKLPSPILISCEQLSYQVKAEEAGYWNKFSPSDRQDALNGLLWEARSAARSSSIFEDAKKEIEAKLASIASLRNWRIIIYYQDKAGMPSLLQQSESSITQK